MDDDTSHSDTVDEVKRVYESLWNKYSSWSKLYNQSKLSGLSRAQARRKLSLQKKPNLPQAQSPDISSSSSSRSSTTTHTCTIIDFDDDGEPQEHTITQIQPTPVDTDMFSPYPPYHSCTPASHNIMVGDDSHYMEFIPFSDDPTYDYSVDLELYHYTSWQKSYIDPEEQHILLETIKRLVSENGMSYQTIDATNVLPIPCHDIVNLIRKRTRRTVIPGAGVTKSVYEDGKAAAAHAQKKHAGRRSAPASELTSSVTRKYAIHVDQEEHGNGLCRNVGIQKGVFKATEVRESEWGLGLFLSEPAEEKELISEYVGEMIRPLTVESRNFHAEHRNRSYVFDLNPTYSLDGAYAGNQTRYMNHSVKAANCHTRVMMVNGEHRIGVYAARRIEEGEELLIDYGIHFWPSESI
ncbi:Histone-lysine N-methyltransferase EZH2 [Psilocybe cubensis]|uniref:Histone-lysine N-methyltransferase EZH2 n=1 Tax=Psilocybe cubensis TaxID=181762 RepID=A0ACB8H359_PSICU|nr:Histone-lysine N-methyltransferase EZH2 [Psilocybe cubensis]KAH9481931.1 Histone-lysine N-methyltransferase EZH2 [Psilocybe cubensis]